MTELRDWAEAHAASGLTQARMVLDLLDRVDELVNGSMELRLAVERLGAEVGRLKEGRFTEEEFQHLCHGFSEADADWFAQGCRDYHRKLFGVPTLEELCQRLVDNDSDE